MDAPGSRDWAHDKLIIETPELTSLEYSLAGIGSRFLALAIDTLIQIGTMLLVSLPLLLLAGGLNELTGGGASWVMAVWILALFLVQYGYFALFETLWHGQTPGKRAMKLRVIKDSGRPIDVYEALVRNLLRIVDSLPGIYAVGIVTALISSQSRRLGDYVAGTVVVHERPFEETQPTWDALETAHLADHGVAGTPGPIGHIGHIGHMGASDLSLKEFELIEAFLSRRDQLSSEVREETSRRILDLLNAKLGLGDRRPEDAEPLLEAIAREGRRAARYR